MRYGRLLARCARLLRLGLAGLALTLVAVSSAVGSTRGDITDACSVLAEARTVVGGQQPGVMLPTKLPPIAYVCDQGPVIVGFAPPDYVATFARGTPVTIRGHVFCKCYAIVQFNVWRGHVKAQVVRGLLFHDGKAGTTIPFTAGRYAGILEVQQHASGPSPESFVWEAGQFTYLFLPLPSIPPVPGLVPRTVIASFRAP